MKNAPGKVLNLIHKLLPFRLRIWFCTVSDYTTYDSFWE